MLTIQTSKATVLAVILPKGAEVKNCIKYEDIDFLFYQMPIIRGMSSMVLPIGSWQPLGFSNMISESDMERIVEQIDSPNSKHLEFSDYENNTVFTSAAESFNSLMEVYGISEEHYLLIKID